MVKICEVVDGCEDCPKYGDDCDGDKRTESTDLISRADAIEAVAQQWLFEASVGNPYVNDDDIGEYRKLAEELFEDIPSADRPSGEWIPLDGKLPKIISHHVLVTIKWADDDLEVCEMCPTVADRYNIIAFQDLPEPYQGEQIKSELQCSGA